MIIRLIFFNFILLLTACSPLGLATTGAQVVYNRNSLEKQFTDQYITMHAYHRIFADTDRYKDANISVATYNQEVLLTGEILDPIKRKEVEQIVKDIDGVTTVYNQLTVSAPSSYLTHASDSWITTKIKSKLIAMNDLDPSKIKVVTENGTVYLMGIVPRDQADQAVEIARNTYGVQNVVKYFSYIYISKV